MNIGITIAAVLISFAIGIPIGITYRKKIAESKISSAEEEAKKFTDYFAMQGADQCGFCNPGFVMNAIALFRENPYPDENEIREYLSGNLCRCSGYEGQLRGILNYIKAKKEKELQ